jgi:endonuclease YncB( thermonuclease family)
MCQCDLKHRPASHKYLFYLVLLLVISSIGQIGCSSAVWNGKVVAIADGDTITVLRGREEVRVRLWGIDTPERRQDFGNRAKQFTADKVFGKKVRVRTVDVDYYGRTVGLVYYGRGYSLLLNEELIESGYAWVYRKYAKEPYESKWLTLENTARKEKRGLWSIAGPIAPWDFRRRK